MRQHGRQFYQKNDAILSVRSSSSHEDLFLRPLIGRNFARAARLGNPLRTWKRSLSGLGTPRRTKKPEIRISRIERKT